MDRKDDNIIQEYLKITKGFVPNDYFGPEKQGQQFVKCSVLRNTSLEYSNVSKERVFLVKQ